MKKPRYIIGIDAGTNTGYAVWDREKKKLILVECVKIYTAMNKIQVVSLTPEYFIVRVEDARKRKWFGNSGREQLQGAGSIKRDARIWEYYLTDLKVTFEMVAPKNNKTKLNAAVFKKVTGWQGVTNEHSRDAAMLVYGF